MTALNITFLAAANPYAAQFGNVTAEVTQAFNAWMQYFDAPLGAVSINVNIGYLGYGEAASAGPNGIVQVSNAGSKATYMAGFAAEIATGAALSDVKRSASLNIDSTWLGRYFADPGANTVEIQRVLLHEIGHMLGFIGYTYQGSAGPVLPTSKTTAFDNYIGFNAYGEYFGGPNAVAAQGGGIKMDFDTVVHTYMPGGVSVMSYLNQAKTIQPLDLAILRDTGLPVLSPQEVAEHQVTRLYLAALGRGADGAGQLFHSRALLTGTSLVDDAATFVGSAEFARLYGATPSNAAFVNTLYQNVLHRGADAGGAKTWNDALAGGVSRAQVLLGFSESAENRAALEVNPNQTYNGTAEAQVERLYDAAFGRTPDALGYGNYTRALLNGTTLQQEALGFLQSQEFAIRYGAASSNGSFVDALYRNALHRAADTAGRAGFVAALDNGVSRVDLLLAFSESPEHTANVIRQDSVLSGMMLTDTGAHLGSIPVLPSSFG